MAHVIDPATGLPLLPPGYFWRVWEVKYRDEYSHYVKVGVVRRKLVKRWWLFSSIEEEIVYEAVIRYRDYALNPATKLRELADYAYRKLDLNGKIAAEEAAKKARVDATLGDYPPKRLSK